MSDLAAVAMAGIMALARAPAVDAEAERPRLQAFAVAIAGAVEERDTFAHWMPGSVVPIPLRGPAAREGMVLVLVAIARHESDFAADVADCRRTGAFEYSITAYQLHGVFARGPYSVRALCSTPRLASERALYVVAHHGARCSTPQGWFNGYAGGDCSRSSRAARRQCAIWERLTARAGLRASCSSSIVQHAE